MFLERRCTSPMRFQDSKSEAKQFSLIIDDVEMYAHIGSVISSLPASDTRLQQIEAYERRIQSANRSKYTAMRDGLTSIP